MTATTTTTRLIAVRQRIVEGCRACNRDPSTVNLMAVSKTKPAELINEAIACGHRHFGENYLQEALEKRPQVSSGPVEWHYIGAIQSNKTRAIAEHFNWVHTVASTKVATRLSAQRPDHLPPLNVLVQINISAESTKEGVSPDDVPALIDSMLMLPRLTIRGLMTIPAPGPSKRQAFARVRALKQELDARYASALPEFVDLSMGMTDDLEEAIAEGSTWLRIGTAIFGSRAI